MKLLVAVSKTPDTTSKIAFADGGKTFVTDGVQYILNPYDEWYALVRALELKEAAGSGSVTVINVGPAANEQIVRKALAIGADDAIRIDAEPSSSAFVAKQIAEQAKAGQYDMILFGKETIDYNGNEVPAMVAEYLDLPVISHCSKIEMAGNVATIERDFDGGIEVLEVSLPIVISASKGLAEQRIPNMQGIMKAKAKPLKVVPAIEVSNGAKIDSYELPLSKSAVKMIDPENMDELVRLLHEEAKVL